MKPLFSNFSSAVWTGRYSAVIVYGGKLSLILISRTETITVDYKVSSVLKIVHTQTSQIRELTYRFSHVVKQINNLVKRCTTPGVDSK